MPIPPFTQLRAGLIRATLTVLVLMVLMAALGGGSPVLAGGGGGKKASPKAEEAADEADEDRVAMPPLVVPLLRRGRLWGQAFLQVELEVDHDIWEVRAQVPRIQDLFVRAVHGTPFDLPDGAETGGRKALGPGFDSYLKGLAEVARDSLGGDLVRSVQVRKLRIMPL